MGTLPWSGHMLTIRMLKLSSLLLLVISCSTEANTKRPECTEGFKAKASLKFSECQDALLPLIHCYQLPETLGPVDPSHLPSRLSNYWDTEHNPEDCKARQNMTSCEALTYLTQVCGAHYDDCHSNKEKMEILRMWIKQFVRGTHELYWEYAFSDNNLEIVNGDCDHILNKFFSKEEMVEITDLVNTEHNIFFDCSNEWENKNCLVEKSNLTQGFGRLIDKDGERIRNFTEDFDLEMRAHLYGGFPLPSHWKYCSWKMKHEIEFMYLKYHMWNLFHCDGKCNTNDGDDQSWGISTSYIDLATGDHIFPDDSPKWDLYNCIDNAEYEMRHGVINQAENRDIDRVKIELCKPFKTILQNCTILMDRCIGNIAIKEIVMTEVLKNMVAESKKAIKKANEAQTDFLANFTYDNCVIFGGEVAGASLHSVRLGYVLVITVMMYFFVL